nr:neuroligin-2-like [Halyomorpha halys]
MVVLSGIWMVVLSGIWMVVLSGIWMVVLSEVWMVVLSEVWMVVLSEVWMVVLSEVWMVVLSRSRYGGDFETSFASLSASSFPVILQGPKIYRRIDSDETFKNSKQGFLKTGSDWPPAAGDISLALSWIKENIESFGGDPRRISIIGHDTGASLANLLLISPQAKGLFSRAILTSGSLLSPWGTGQDPGGLRLRLAAAAGCRIEPLACLRALPPSSLTALRVPAPRFLTAVGPWVHGEAASAVEVAGDPFLSSRLMIGTTTTESFLDFNSHEIQYGIEEDQRNRVLRTYVRNAYDYHLNEIFSTVRNEYTDWEKPIQHPINIRDSTLEALSDGHTVAPLLRLGYLHARRGSPTYFYHFSHHSKESSYPERLGSVRGEDVHYLLGLPLVDGYPFFPQNYTSQDHKVAEIVLNFFTNFAKTG